MSNPALLLPRLRRDQYEIAMHPAKIKAISAGRRFGKTVLGGVMALVAASQGCPVAWIAPEYKNMRPLWRFARRAVAPLKAAGFARVSEADKLIEFHSSGGFLALFSADNPDSILGDAFRLVICDEAARIAESVVMETIFPTLADFSGDLLLLSTPRGMNWFYAMFMRGLDDGEYIHSWHAPTYANPMPTIRAAYERAREIVPEMKFKQEWDAEFVTDGTGVFTNVDACATAKPQTKALYQHEYIQGIDIGKLQDATVIVTYDLTTYEIVNIVRLMGMDYSRQRLYIMDAFRRFNPVTIIVEKNNAGEAVIDELKKLKLPIRPFLTTLATKNALVDTMALELQNVTTRMIPDETLLNEFKAFSGKLLPSGFFQYAAAYGHDDCVMAAMLATWGARKHARRITVTYKKYG